MKKILRISAECLLCVLLLQSCSVFRNPLRIKNYVEVETSNGNFVVGLYEGTPLHRDNFMSNCTSGLYEGTLLYSLVRNSDYSFGLRRGFSEAEHLRNNFEAGRTLLSEINEKIYPKRGAIAMKTFESPDNTGKMSDACLFFLVDGGEKMDMHIINASVAIRNRDTYKIYIDKFLAKQENKPYKDSLVSMRAAKNMDGYNELYAEIMKIVKPVMIKDGVELFEISDKIADKYLKTGGVPMFEGCNTIFGEIVVGLDVMQKLSSVECRLNRQPKNDISILKTVVLSKKEFKEKYKNN